MCTSVLSNRETRRYNIANRALTTPVWFVFVLFHTDEQNVWLEVSQFSVSQQISYQNPASA